jgi:hypothetical protein
VAGIAELVLQIKGKDDLSKPMRDASGELDNFTDSAKKADKSAADMETTFDKLQRGVDEMGNKLEDVSQKIKRDDIAAQVADSFGNTERVLIGVSDQLGVLEEKFGLPVGPAREWAQAGADVAGGMEGIIAGGSGLIKTFGPMLSGIGTQIAATWAHVAALTAQAAAMLVAYAPIILVIAGIALLAAGIYLLVKHWDTITEKVPILGTALEKVQDIVLKAKDLMIGAFNNVVDFLKDNWPIVASLIFLPFAPLILLATDAFGIRSALVDAFEAVLGFMTDHWREIAGLISLPFAPLILLATDGFGIRSKLIEAFTAVLDFLIEWGGKVVAFFGGFVTSVTEALGDWYDKGKRLITGFIDGILSMGGAVYNAAKNIGNKAFEGVKDGAGKLWPGSPSQAGIDVGYYFADGIRVGMDAGLPLVDLATDNIGRTIINSLRDTTNAIPNELRNLAGEVEENMLENMGAGVIGWINSLGDEVRLALSGILKSIDWASYGKILYEDMSVGDPKPQAPGGGRVVPGLGGGPSSYVLGSDGKWYKSEADMPAGVTGASTSTVDPRSPTRNGTVSSYIGGGQYGALPQMPNVGDQFNGMTWTGSQWSQHGATSEGGSIQFNGPITINEAGRDSKATLKDVAFTVASELRSRGMMVPA